MPSSRVEIKLEDLQQSLTTTAGGEKKLYVYVCPNRNAKRDEKINLGRINVFKGHPDLFEQVKTSIEFQEKIVDAQETLLSTKKFGGKVKRQKNVQRGTLLELWNDFKNSRDQHGFGGLKKSTQENKIRRLSAFIKAHQHLRWQKIERNQIKMWRDNVKKNAADSKAGGVEAANNFVKDISSLFTFAEKDERTPAHWSNPARRLKLAADENIESGGYTWTAEDFKQYRDFWPHGTMERLAGEILFTLGVRVSDAIRLQNNMGKQDWGVHNNMIIFQPMKQPRKRQKKITLYLQIEPELQAALDQRPNIFHIKYPSPPWLVTQAGKPFASAKSFSNWFKKRCLRAGLNVECTPHGCRRGLATAMAENGATHNELMTHFGWTRSEEADVYTEAARFKRQITEKRKVVNE
jgi:integrase